MEPDPSRASTDTPTRLGRVVSLVRKLIDYGKQLAATVQQRAGAPGFAFLARPFGTADLAVILARITCGLRRRVLEARLCKRASGRDLTVAPIRLPAIRAPGASTEASAARPSPPKTRASPACPPKRKSPPRCVAAQSAPSSSISAAISALHPAISIGRSGTKSATPSSYGGNLVRLFNDLSERLWAFGPGDPSDCAGPGWLEPPPRSPVPATGPP
jgi:hypothetical protein